MIFLNVCFVELIFNPTSHFLILCLWQPSFSSASMALTSLDPIYVRSCRIYASVLAYLLSTSSRFINSVRNNRIFYFLKVQYCFMRDIYYHTYIYHIYFISSLTNSCLMIIFKKKNICQHPFIFRDDKCALETCNRGIF